MNKNIHIHYGDVIMGATASQITSLAIVYSTDYSASDQRKQQSSASLAFVRGIHRWPVNSPHKGPVTWKMFPFDDVIMFCTCLYRVVSLSCRCTSLCPSLKASTLKRGNYFRYAIIKHVYRIFFALAFIILEHIIQAVEPHADERQRLACSHRHPTSDLGPFYLTWIIFYPSMDK